MLHVVLNPTNEVITLCMLEFYKRCSAEGATNSTEEGQSDGSGGGGMSTKQTKPEIRDYVKSSKHIIKQELAVCFSQGCASPNLTEENKRVLHMDDDNAVFVKLFKACLKTDAKMGRYTRRAMERVYKEITAPDGIHLLYLFIKFVFFMGYVYVFMSRDIEGAHHILFCMLCIAFNSATKLITLIVGLLGNNGKSIMMQLIQDILFGKTMASVALPTLREVNDSNSHSGNLMPLLGSRSVLMADECGIEKPKVSRKEQILEDKRRKEEEQNAPPSSFHHWPTGM